MAVLCTGTRTDGGPCTQRVTTPGHTCGRHTATPTSVAPPTHTGGDVTALTPEPFGDDRRSNHTLRPDGTPWPTTVDFDGNTWTRRPPSRLSPSAFNAWRSCERGFAFDRIQRRPDKPGLPASILSLIHI